MRWRYFFSFHFSGVQMRSLRLPQPAGAVLKFTADAGSTQTPGCLGMWQKDESTSCSLKDDVYRLDDQTYAEKFAGAKVKVTGTLDAKAHTLRSKSSRKAADFYFCVTVSLW